MAPRFLAHFVVAFGALLLLVAGVNRVVDPFRARGGDSSRLYGVDERMAVGFEAHGPRDTVLVGSSRVWFGYDPRDPRLLDALGPTQNAAVSACTMIEAAAIARHVSAAVGARRIVVGLDLGMFLTSQRVEPDFDLEGLRGSLAPEGLLARAGRWRRLLLSRAATGASFRRLFREPHHRLAEAAARLGRDALTRRAVAIASTRWRSDARRGAAPFPAQLQALTELLEEAARTRRAVRLVVNPHHVWYHQALRSAGLDSWRARWRRELAARVEGARSLGADVEWWDFSALHEVTTGPVDGPHFWDGSHFTPVVGARIAQRLSGADDDFGVRIDAHGIETFLAQLGAQLDDWAVRHPIDVAEIEAIVEPARH